MTIIVAIEGIDGAGKGTQAKRLVRRLSEAGYSVAGLQFPRYSETTFGAAIADFLNGKFGDLNDVHPQLAAVLYAGDRFESRDVLQNAIDTSDIVIIDRFTGSNLAHQSAKLAEPEASKLRSWIEKVEIEVFGLPRPDLNILIDISPDWSRELVSRKNTRDYTTNEADLQEADLSYLERVRACYRKIASEQPNWKVVESLSDGTLRPVEEIGNEIFDLVTSICGTSSAG